MQITQRSFVARAGHCLVALSLLAGFSAFAQESKTERPDGWRSAKFGMKESEVKAALQREFKITEADIKSTTVPVTMVKVLTVDLGKSFAPLGLPATAGFVFGYHCKCLTEVSVSWNLTGVTEEKRNQAMQGVESISQLLQSKYGGPDATGNQATQGPGGGLAVSYFLGPKPTGATVTLMGGPVKLPENVSNAQNQQVSVQAGDMTYVMLIYQKDRGKPDIFTLPKDQF